MKKRKKFTTTYDNLKEAEKVSLYWKSLGYEVVKIEPVHEHNLDGKKANKRVIEVTYILKE